MAVSYNGTGETLHILLTLLVPRPAFEPKLDSPTNQEPEHKAITAHERADYRDTEGASGGREGGRSLSSARRGRRDFPQLAIQAKQQLLHQQTIVTLVETIEKSMTLSQICINFKVVLGTRDFLRGALT